jgi:hypothetical protein
MNRAFSSLGAIARHCFGIAVRERAADIAGRAEIGHVFVTEAQRRIGKPSLLPPPLAPSTLARRAALGYTANTPLLMTGDLKRSIAWQHDGSRETSVGSPSKIALYQELGTPRIPARSFLAASGRTLDKRAFKIYLRVYGMTIRL